MTDPQTPEIDPIKEATDKLLSKDFKAVTHQAKRLTRPIPQFQDADEMKELILCQLTEVIATVQGQVNSAVKQLVSADVLATDNSVSKLNAFVPKAFKAAFDQYQPHIYMLTGDNWLNENVFASTSLPMAYETLRQQDELDSITLSACTPRDLAKCIFLCARRLGLNRISIPQSIEDDSIAQGAVSSEEYLVLEDMLVQLQASTPSCVERMMGILTHYVFDGSENAYSAFKAEYALETGVPINTIVGARLRDVFCVNVSIRTQTHPHNARSQEGLDLDMYLTPVEVAATECVSSFYRSMSVREAVLGSGLVFTRVGLPQLTAEYRHPVAIMGVFSEAYLTQEFQDEAANTLTPYFSGLFAMAKRFTLAVHSHETDESDRFASYEGGIPGFLARFVQMFR